jgi:cytochrome c
MWTELRAVIASRGQGIQLFCGTRSEPSRAAIRRASFFLMLACTSLPLAGCDADSEAGPVNFSGNPSRGATLIKQYQCGSCHLIPKVSDASGNVGPPLLHVGTRTYIAGFIHNSPDNMSRWIQDPQAALPGNAMPRTGVTPEDARDITAFLYTLK